MYHIMPWEIDYALLTFQQLKKSKYYLPDGYNITIKSALNLSSYLIDWDSSKLPRDYFIAKYTALANLLVDYNHQPYIYDGCELWGHLDYQKMVISNETDYYIAICPDIYFSEYLLSYLLQAAGTIKNEYFVLTPEICRMWDNTWDVITHPKFNNGPYVGWEKSVDIYDVDFYHKSTTDPVSVESVDQLKWAGWFDLYNKKYYEDLGSIPDDWRGYGALDYYGMNVAYNASLLGYDFKQYKLTNQIAFEYSVGPLRTDTVNGFSNYYRDFIVRKDVSEQRNLFNLKLNDYINRKVQILNSNENITHSWIKK